VAETPEPLPSQFSRQSVATRASSTLSKITFRPGTVVSAMRALFWDVGGVLLSNAWDRQERSQALEHFHVDPDEFQSRHEMVVSSFERGKLTLDEYLDRTIFYRPRPFGRGEFRDVMFSLSQPLPDHLAFAQSLANSRKYFMATINNESRELNDYRIEKFGLCRIFQLFVSSCFVGLRKPERDIYRLALEITQIPAEQCSFIDDRALNLECAKQMGMHTIEMKGLESLRAQLAKLGVSP
jgi:putative hydrolase of the HAD superfamily